MPDPCMIICRAILNDSKFDKLNFLNNDFTEFWRLVNEYLHSHAKSHESAVLKRLKYAHTDTLLDALKKLLEIMKPDHFKIEIIPLIDHAFCCLMHWETPEKTRSAALQLLIEFIQLLPDEKAELLSNCVNFMIPFIRLARKQSEKDVFSLVSGNVTAVAGPTPQGTTENTLVQLGHILQFLNHNWEKRKVYCCNFFFKNIVGVIYRPISKEFANFYGFEGPVINTLHLEVLKFFKGFIEYERDFIPLFDSISKIDVILGILQNSTIQTNIQTFEILTYFFKNQTISDQLFKVDESIYFQFIYVFLHIFRKEFNTRSELRPEAMNSSRTTFYALVDSASRLYQLPKVLELIEFYFKTASSNNQMLVFCTYIFLEYLIVPANKTKEIWDTFRNLVKKNSLIAAAASKYSQHLACLGFPIVLPFDIATVQSECKISTNKSRRAMYRGKASFDFIAPRIDQLLDEPQIFARKQLTSFWPAHSELDSILEKVPISPIALEQAGFDNETISLRLELFLSAFDDYINVKDPEAANSEAQIDKIVIRCSQGQGDEEETDTEQYQFSIKNENGQMGNIFSVLINYYGTLSVLNHLPPTVMRENPNYLCVLEASSPRLFKATLNLTLNNYDIFKRSFEILSQIFNIPEIGSSLTKKYLSHWYFTLILGLGHKNIEMKKIAFNETFNTVSYCFIGSTIFIPILLQMLEDKIIDIPHNPHALGFLSSLSLFNVDSICLPDQLINFMKQNEIKLPFNPKNMHSRVINLINDHISSTSKISKTHPKPPQTAPKPSGTQSKGISGGPKTTISNLIATPRPIKVVVVTTKKSKNDSSSASSDESQSESESYSESEIDQAQPEKQDQPQAEKPEQNQSQSDYSNQTDNDNENKNSEDKNDEEETMDDETFVAEKIRIQGEISKVTEYSDGYLSLIGVVIADELASDNPNTGILAQMIMFLINLISISTVKVLFFIRSQIPHLKKLAKLNSDEIIELTDTVATYAIKTTLEDNVNEIGIEAIETSVILYIYNSNLFLKNKIYEDFCRHLMKLSEEDLNYASFSLELLGIYFAKYPFPDSIQFPNSKFVNSNLGPLFSIDTHSLIEVSSLGKNATRMDILTNAGHFTWGFYAISSELYKDERIADVSIPLSSDTKGIPQINTQKQQKDFVAKMNEVSEFFYMEAPPLTSEISEIMNEINSAPQEIPETNIGGLENSIQIDLKPPTELINVSAAAMTAMGFVPALHPEQLKPIDLEPKTLQLLKKGEKLNHRIRTSIGVLFLKQNDSTEEQIASNTMETTTPRFKEFLNGLGWILEDNQVVYSDFSHEIDFHVSPLMNKGGMDKIVNDGVHIVWSENPRKYDSSTIGSPHNNCQIIIYPLRLNLFRVEVQWREDMYWFGPLRYTCIVDKRVLPALVRETALIAQVRLWKAVENHRNPMTEISKIITEISSKVSMGGHLSFKGLQNLIALNS